MKISEVYLVQRAAMRENISNSQVVGYDSAFSNDFMGSAEYEFGALAKSLRKITPNLEHYQIFAHKTLKHPDGRGLFMFCRPEVKDDLSSILEILATDGSYSSKHGYQLKESAYLDNILKGQKSGLLAGINLWWDIENLWFAGLGKPVVVRLELALKKLKEKWANAPR